jgi:hypothetical protein
VPAGAGQKVPPIRPAGHDQELARHVEKELLKPRPRVLARQGLLSNHRGVQSARYVLDGAGHGDMAIPGSACPVKLWKTTPVMDLMINFLGKQLAS